MMATAVYDNDGAGVIAGTLALAPQFEGRLEESERASQVEAGARCGGVNMRLGSLWVR